LDGISWLVAVALVSLVLLATGVTVASPALAQTEPDGLGDELYPPTRYETSEAQGVFPVGHYDIGCHNGGFFGDISCATLGTTTNLVFSAGKHMVGMSVWLLEAAVGFTVEAALTDAATAIADLLDQRVLGPIGVAHLGLVVSALYMGWQFARGRVGVGAGEFALSLIVLAVLIHVTTGVGFGRTVTGAVEATSGLAVEVVSLAADTESAGITGRVGNALVAGFVRDPYDTIAWGRPLTGTACEEARNQILAGGPHGNDDTSRQTMTDAGCTAEAEFNAQASADRLVGALLHMVATILALVLLVVTAFTLVVAKGLSLLLVALLPIALHAGVFPGAGRSLLWHWVSALVRVLALILAMGVFLALLVAGLTGLLGLSQGLWERFLLVLFFMAVMWVGRKQLVDISGRFADSTFHRLDAAGLGGGHGAAWVRPYQAGGLTGLGVTRTIRESNGDYPTMPTRRPSGITQTGQLAAAVRWGRRTG
jgi:hypothetical protein